MDGQATTEPEGYLHCLLRWEKVPPLYGGTVSIIVKQVFSDVSCCMISLTVEGRIWFGWIIGMQ